MYAYSPTAVPRPKEWRGGQHICECWFLDPVKDYQPEQVLLDFLAAGPLPVCIGFGSLIDHEREEVNTIVIDALRETGQRGILLGGWGGLGSSDLPDSILHKDAVPHDWLFPRVAAVVHHGGAGTTAAGLRAGVPGVVVPSFAGQFFWGWSVQQLGAGPKAIPLKFGSGQELLGIESA